ncbi:DUF1266 domain-containing protein [Paenibacillus sp. UNC451MF]|uniref:DUF1266 domain-containing protein n=1 Tax=Paenibacillus sp. UNC451MF TaxID=1449063 RepID=UPI00048C76A6|nr:DUF1266 domain-containing protein [Paenibacillus sp. UNC451MF]
MNYYDPTLRKQLAFYVNALSSFCMKGQMAYSLANKMHMVFENKTRLRNALELWRIDDPRSLRATLQWLFDTGIRKEFEDYRMLLSGLTESERNPYLQSLPEGERRTRRLLVANYYLMRLPAEGIAAFDHSWCVYLCCAGYHLGYLTEEDKWRIVAMSLQNARESYTNWKEYLISYAAGADFFDATPSLDYVKNYNGFLIKLLTGAESPLTGLNLR